MSKTQPLRLHYFIDSETFHKYPSKVLGLLSPTSVGFFEPAVLKKISTDPSHGFADLIAEKRSSGVLVALPSHSPRGGRIDVANTWGLDPEKHEILRSMLQWQTDNNNYVRVALTSDKKFAKVVRNGGLYAELLWAPNWLAGFGSAVLLLSGLSAILIFHQQLAATWRLWSLPAIIGLAIFAFWCRCKNRFWYGIVEIIFGIFCAVAAIFLNKPIADLSAVLLKDGVLKSPSQAVEMLLNSGGSDSLIKFLGAIYIVVRGLDNIDSTKPQGVTWGTRWQGWGRIFSKPAK